MIDQDLLSYLIALGTAAGSRVHLGNAPQDSTLPAVIVRRIGGARPQTLGGVSLFSRAQFSINVITNEYSSAYPIATAINTALHGFTGTMITTQVSSCRCIAFPADQSEINGDKVIRWVQQDFLIVHS